MQYGALSSRSDEPRQYTPNEKRWMETPIPKYIFKPIPGSEKIPFLPKGKTSKTLIEFFKDEMDFFELLRTACQEFPDWSQEEVSKRTIIPLKTFCWHFDWYEYINRVHENEIKDLPVHLTDDEIKDENQKKKVREARLRFRQKLNKMQHLFYKYFFKSSYNYGFREDKNRMNTRDHILNVYNTFKQRYGEHPTLFTRWGTVISEFFSENATDIEQLLKGSDKRLFTRRDRSSILLKKFNKILRPIMLENVISDSPSLSTEQSPSPSPSLSTEQSQSPPPSPSNSNSASGGYISSSF